MVLTNARLLLPAAMLVNALLLWNFHDQHWYAIDEGSYAHIAERVLAGEVLYRDIQDIHPGYVHFLNAAAFAAFGVDLVSLRYPLAVAAFAQALLVWFLLARRDVLLATVASVAAIALGLIQFLDPSANWYCLFLAVCLVCWLTWVPSDSRWRAIGAGFLVGLIALFKQLTGVWVAMAVLVILLREQSTGARGREVRLARGLVLLMLVALLGYLSFGGGPEASGNLLIGSWPVVILCLVLRDAGATNRACLRVLSQLAVGCAVAALPMVVYHLAHGSFAAWIDDTVFAALEHVSRPFFESVSFAVLPAAGLVHVLQPGGAAAFANGLYWLILPLLPAVNGILIVVWMRRRRVDGLILPVMAAFYSLVTLYLPGVIYFYYTVGLTVAAVLWFVSSGAGRRHIPYVAAAAVALIVIAVWFHAAQSPYRRPSDVGRGYRTLTADTPRCAPFARSSLRIEWNDCASYHLLSQAIEAETPPGSYIFAVPDDAELYFLTARSNPFRFFNTANGVRTSKDLAPVLEVLANRPPRLVTYRLDDKYNTEASRKIMEYVRSTYERFDTIAGVELYRPRNIQRQGDE
ncbi:MAG: hypothetical protein ACRD3C_19010 [Vicinamibacterales bacterium]